MKKRILQLSNYYAPEIGGIEKIAQAITDSAKGQYDVRIICFTHGKNSKIDEIDGIKVIRCGTRVKIASQQLSTEMLKIIQEQISSYDPDIIIVHAPNPFLEWILLKYIRKNCKLVVYWHSDIVKQKIGRILVSGLTERLLKRTQKIIATSPNYIEGSYYLNKYKDKCLVIPNCIDTEQLVLNNRAVLIAEEIKQNNKNKHICICVGRQVPYKGFEYAIQAVNQLNNEYVLYVLGREGEATKRLKEIAGDSKRIVFCGEVDDDTLHAYMTACEIFCFPSVTKNEAFGIALAEGMYFNKPAVTFHIPGSGVNYVNIHNQTGIEVANRDASAFAEAVRLLAENREVRERYGIAAGNRVRELFLSEQFKENVKGLIESL